MKPHVKFSSALGEDLRLLSVSKAARWAYVAGLCVMARYDWPYLVRGGLGFVGGNREIAKQLVAAGLWEKRADGGGWNVVEVPAPKRPSRAHLPNMVRAFVMERDGYLCVACGAIERLTIDHIVAVSRGGSHHPTNLQVLCQPCNSRKGAR